MKLGIALDSWKLPIFARHLTKAGYTFVNKGRISEGALLLHVEAPGPQAIEAVVRAANTEAALTGKPNPRN